MSLRDLNVMKKPLCVSFGMTAAILTENPYAGVAGYCFALSSTEMLRMIKLKMACQYANWRQILRLN